MPGDTLKIPWSMIDAQLKAEGFNEDANTLVGIKWTIEKLKEYIDLLDSVPTAAEAGVAGMAWIDKTENPLALLHGIDKLHTLLEGFHDAVLYNCMARYTVKPPSDVTVN